MKFNKLEFASRITHKFPYTRNFFSNHRKIRQPPADLLVQLEKIEPTSVASKEEARNYLKLFAQALRHSFNLHREGAQKIWHLIEKGHPARWEKELVALQFLEISQGALLLEPEVAELTVKWKRDEQNNFLKKISKIFAPGNAGKGKGGLHKRWPQEKEDEVFARIHSRVKLGKNLLPAVRFTAKEMGLKSADALRKRYRTRLEQLRSYFSDEEIDKAVISSLK